MKKERLVCFSLFFKIVTLFKCFHVKVTIFISFCLDRYVKRERETAAVNITSGKISFGFSSGYHSYCVDRWLVKMSNRCPLCKQRVSISLFCPWSKERRTKERGSGGQDRISMAELETEASLDESPPVPPLSTLTPSCWYGEDIMSGEFLCSIP